MSLEQYAHLVAEISAMLAERQLSPELLINFIAQSTRTQLRNENALSAFFTTSPITQDDENSFTVTLSHPHEPADPPTRSFYTPRPVFFHAVIETYPFPSQTGTHVIIAHPRAPNGQSCVLETGHTVVVHPNYTIAWYLESYTNNEHHALINATNDQVGVIRNFIVKREWMEEIPGSDEE